jgi:hypothetical protein
MVIHIPLHIKVFSFPSKNAATTKLHFFYGVE